MIFQLAVYIGVHKEWRAGLFNRAVRMLDCTDASHVELVFSDGLSASSSYMDGGVRFKRIDYSDKTKWRLHDLPPEKEAYARAFAISHKGEGYDVWAIIWSVIGFVRTPPIDKWTCSEFCMAALVYDEFECFRFRPRAAEVVAIGMVK